MGHSRIDTTQLFNDEIELDEPLPRSTVQPISVTHMRRQIRRRLTHKSPMSSKRGRYRTRGNLHRGDPSFEGSTALYPNRGMRGEPSSRFL
jgi:hypothetical protein